MKEGNCQLEMTRKPQKLSFEEPGLQGSLYYYTFMELILNYSAKL